MTVPAAKQNQTPRQKAGIMYKNKQTRTQINNSDSTASDRTVAPRYGFELIRQSGIKALAAFNAQAGVLADRVAPETVAQLRGDNDALNPSVSEAQITRARTMVRTAEQQAVLDRGFKITSAVRAAVSRTRQPATVRKAYGVGILPKVHSVKGITAALGLIIERATASPAEALAFGITADDVVTYTATLAEIRQVNGAQEQAMSSARKALATRNTIANRVFDAVARISSAGVLQFANDPEKRAEFAALVPSVRKSTGHKAAPSAGAASGPESDEAPKAA